jgi:arginine exporter protein ArgO
MIVSTILLIAFGFMRGFLLEADLQTTADNVFIIGFFYLLWYFCTYFLTNLINSVEDPSAKIRQSQYREITIATILFFVLFGYWHTILTGKEVNSGDIVLTTLLFALWYFISVEMANRFM